MGRYADGYLELGGHGQLAGNASATQMPDRACRKVVFEAVGANSGKIYIGLSSGVTTPGASTNETCGIEVPAGTTIEFYVSNMNELWYICANAADDLTYFFYT